MKNPVLFTQQKQIPPSTYLITKEILNKLPFLKLNQMFNMGKSL